MIAAHPRDRRAGLEARHRPWRHTSLGALFEDTATQHPDRPLVMTASGTASYGDVLDRSRRIATLLARLGIGAGDHVAILLPNGVSFVATKFAIARIGAVAVPVNFNLQRDELAYVIAQSDARALIAVDSFRGRDYLPDLRAILPADFCVVIDGEADARPWQTLSEAEHCAPAANAILVRPEDLADIIYTSGTTGYPKGVMLTHDMVLRTAYASALVRAFEDGRRLIFAAPMYHVHGYVECLVAAMFVGGAVVPQERFDAAGLLELAVRHRANEISGVPALTERLLAVAREHGFACPSLSCVFSTGGLHRPEIWQEFRDVLTVAEVVTAYGMTETTASTVCTRPEDPIERVMHSNGCLKQAGVAAPATARVLAEYKVVDAETGRALPNGTPGELLCRGAGVTHGYYKKPTETAEALSTDGWLRVGDFGRIDADGFLTYVGRTKDLYRCGGETVMPREVEAVLEMHDRVGEAFVVALPDDRMGEIGCACIVPVASAPSAEELIAWCETRLARFKVPRHVLIFDAHDIPLTSTGRVRKFQLAEIARERLTGGG